MRLPIRSRLSLNFMVVLLVGMGLAAGLTWLAVARLYTATQAENLLAQARITAAALDAGGFPIESIEPVEPYNQTANIAPGIHTRLLSESGAVLIGLPTSAGEVPIQVPAAENTGFVSADQLRQRPEIQRALAGEATTAVRVVDSAGGRRVLYAAAPVQEPESEIATIVYLATPLPAAGLPPDIILQFLGVLFIAIVLAMISGALLARGIARPIEDLGRAALAVSEGDLNQAVPVEYGGVEIGSLGEAFNTMTASLRRLEQVKNAFIADVTHELRTPLTVIKGTIETLEDGALDDLDGRGPLLASMGRETDRLIRLVKDLLVLTRADASALRLFIQPLDLGALAHARCKHLAPLAELRQVGLDVHTQGSEYRVRGDSDRLAQVLDNLLGNAIRHAPTNSTVRISLNRTRDEVECAVSDQGPGISEDHLPFIFERFYRVEPSRDRQTGGTGLGLAIVQALVQAHGGRISVDSVLGSGTTFTFCLPASAITVELPGA